MAPVPDKWADEPVVELDPNLKAQYDFCIAEAKKWTDQANKLKDQIISQMGTATAALVGGQKVATYRPTSGYAEASLRRDYPELTQHFMRDEVRSVFNIELFAKLHPEIADKYRTHQFRLAE